MICRQDYHHQRQTQDHGMEHPHGRLHCWFLLIELDPLHLSQSQRRKQSTSLPPHSMDISRSSCYGRLPHRRDDAAHHSATHHDNRPTMAVADTRQTWNVRSATTPGVWFCGHACQDIWDTPENVDGIIGLTNSSIEKAVVRMKKNQAKMPAQTSTTHHHDVSRTKLDSGWESAEKCKRNITGVVLLNETELDIAHLATDAIVRRYIEDNPPSGTGHRHARWAEFMDLQYNELPLVRTRPYTGVSGNAIGIWQLSPTTTDDGEMFGWGVYISGAYFQPQYAQRPVYMCFTTFHQHLFAGCEPNIRKAPVYLACHWTKDTYALGNRRSSHYIYI